MHIIHGNTSAKEVEVQLMSLNVAGLMLSLKGGEIEASNSHKLKKIDAHVSLWHRPALIAFQECGGGWAERHLFLGRVPIHLKANQGLNPLEHFDVVSVGAQTKKS